VCHVSREGRVPGALPRESRVGGEVSFPSLTRIPIERVGPPHRGTGLVLRAMSFRERMEGASWPCKRAGLPGSSLAV